MNTAMALAVLWLLLLVVVLMVVPAVLVTVGNH